MYVSWYDKLTCGTGCVLVPVGGISQGVPIKFIKSDYEGKYRPFEY